MSRGFGELSAPEVEKGRAALAEHIGPEASDVAWLRRLVWEDDGLKRPGWKLAVRRVSSSGNRMPQDFEVARRLLPLEEAVAFVRSGGEGEADRVEAAWAKARAELAAIEEADQKRRAEIIAASAGAEVREREDRKRYEDQGGLVWEKLGSWPRLVLRLALLEEETPGGRPEMAKVLRALAAEADTYQGPGQTAAGPSWPGREWRR